MESSNQALTSSDSIDSSKPAISTENTEDLNSYEVSQKLLNPPIHSIDNNSIGCPENNERKQSFGTDNTSMTIDFLRARLLSERSISKSAKERAKHLAKKVIELESLLAAELNKRKLSQAAVEKALVELQSAGLQEQSAHIDLGTKQADDEKQKEGKRDDLVAPTKALNEDLGIKRANSRRYSETSSQPKNDLTVSEYDEKLERGCDPGVLDRQNESDGSSVVEPTVDEVVVDDIPENTNHSAVAVSPFHCSKQGSRLNSVRKIGRSCRVFKGKSIGLTESSTPFKLEVPSDQDNGKGIPVGPEFSVKDSQLIEMKDENAGFKKQDSTASKEGEAAESGSSHVDHIFQKGDSINSINELTDEQNVKLSLGVNDIPVSEKSEGQGCESQQCNQITEEGVGNKVDTRSHDADAKIGLADEHASYEVHDAETRLNTDSKSTLQHDAKFCSSNKVFEDVKSTATERQTLESALLRCSSKKASTIQHEANSESLSESKVLLQEGGLWGCKTNSDTCNQQRLNGSLHGFASLQTESQHIVSMESNALQISSYQNKPCLPSDVSDHSDQQVYAGESSESPIIGVIEESSGNESIRQCNQCMSQIQRQGKNLEVSPRCSLKQRSGLKQDEEKLKSILGRSRLSCNVFAAEELEEMNQDSSEACCGAGFVSLQNIKPCIAKVAIQSMSGDIHGSNHYYCGHIEDAPADNVIFDVRQKKEFVNCSCGKCVNDNYYQKMERNKSNLETKKQAVGNNLHLKVTNNVDLDNVSLSSIGSQYESTPETLTDQKMERDTCTISQYQFSGDGSYKKAGLQGPKNWSQDQFGCACVHVLDDYKKNRQADNRTSCHRPRKHGKSIKARSSFTRSDLCSSHAHGCTDVSNFSSFGESRQSHNSHDMAVDNDVGNIATCSGSVMFLENGFLCRNVDSGHVDYPYRMPPNWNRNEKGVEATSNKNGDFLRILPPETRPYDACPEEPRQNVDLAYLERHRSLSSQFLNESRMDNRRETKKRDAFRSGKPSQALLPATAYMGQSEELISLKGNENLHTVLAALSLAKEHMRSSSDQRQLSSNYADAVHYNIPLSYGTRSYFQRSFDYPSERANLDLLSTREINALREREYRHMNKNAYEYRNSFSWDRMNSRGSRQEYPWYRFIEQLPLNPEFSYMWRGST